MPTLATLLDVYGANAGALASLLGVAAHLSPWVRLEFMLDLAGRQRGDEQLAAELYPALDRWSLDMYQCFVEPRPEQVPAILQAWGGAGGRLPKELRQNVALQLRAFHILEDK